MVTVYGMADSGNCYKVKLALEQLGKPCRWVEVDSTKGETRSREFLARNPNGKVPTLQLEEPTKQLAEQNDGVFVQRCRGGSGRPALGVLRAPVAFDRQRIRLALGGEHARRQRRDFRLRPTARG
mgnify:CR=1 FL=1